MSAGDERGKKERPVVWESGIPIDPVYDASDGAGERPGEFPYTRGIHPTMYRRRPFTMRQYAGFGTPAETRRRFAYLIERGQTGLNVAFDLPTQCGLDSDDPMAEGEVGRVGMSVDTLADMEEAFQGIDLGRISVSLTINGAAAPIMGMFFAMARRRGMDLSHLRGTAQNDILKEFIGRGTWIFPVQPSVRLVGDTMEFCARNVPRYSPVSVCGYHIRESGATPAQEMAYALAIACAYVEHVLERGPSIDEVAPGLSFNFDVHGNLWEEVAKLRAGRRLWAKLMRDRYGAKNERSMQLRMIAGGGGAGLTVEQPENNIVRGAYYALASALGGAQTMALCCWDEAYTIPSEAASRLSLRTMQILTEEVGICDTADPLGGSHFIEATTDAMEERITQVLDRLQAEGGVIQAVEEGRIQAEVSRQAYERHKRIRSGELRKVGVNCYAEHEEERPVELHPYREDEVARQIERTRAIRSQRNQEAVRNALKAVRAAASSRLNVVPPILDAVEAMATVGEICAELKDVLGTYREPIRF